MNYKSTLFCIPFILDGTIVCFLYFRTREDESKSHLVWLYILLSFLFYIPVAAGTESVPVLGMLMLPKTACYILLIAAFLHCITGKGRPG